MNNRYTEIHLFFPTPVWTSIIENEINLNNKLYKYIQNLKNKNPEGLYKSNFKGWHSKYFNLEEKVPKLFLQKIYPSIKESLIDMDWNLEKQKIKITSMWSIINQREALNGRHIHGNNFISAAYYVKAPKNCGNIVFFDPRSAPTFNHPITKSPNKLNADSHNIKPMDGLLVLFPSYLHHAVEPNMSDEERIVISFNINLIKN